MSEHTRRLLVPVSDSSTLRNTVAYAVRTAHPSADERPTGIALHFVFPASWRSDVLGAYADTEAARELLDRVRIWAREDLGLESIEETAGVTVETAIVGTDRYLFNPRDYADVIAGYAREHDLVHVVLDPKYRPAGRARLLQPLEYELEADGLAVEVAPVERPTRPARLVRRGTGKPLLAMFAGAYLFYLVIGATGSVFDLVTGAVSAGIVAVLFHRISFNRPVPARRTAVRTLRMGAYAPFLFWEILKANIELAYVILHPRLPIDPTLVRYRPGVWGDLPATTLANSITLTPGTLTVDVTREVFLVHAMTDGARRSLADGGLERGVRFVFYGRSAARVPTPGERGDIAIEDDR